MQHSSALCGVPAPPNAYPGRVSERPWGRLSSFSLLWYKLWYESFNLLFLLSYWRRGRDSNPGRRYPRWFSRPVLSTAQPPLRQQLSCSHCADQSRLHPTFARPLRRPMTYRLQRVPHGGEHLGASLLSIRHPRNRSSRSHQIARVEHPRPTLRQVIRFRLISRGFLFTRYQPTCRISPSLVVRD